MCKRETDREREIHSLERTLITERTSSGKVRVAEVEALCVSVGTSKVSKNDDGKENGAKRAEVGNEQQFVGVRFRRRKEGDLGRDLNNHCPKSEELISSSHYFITLFFI